MGSAESINNTELGTQPQLIFSLLPELAGLSDSVELSGRLELERVIKGPMLVRLPDGVAYDVRLTNTGTGILLTGTASASALTDCARCAEEAQLWLSAEVDCYYVIDPHGSEVADDDESVVFLGKDKQVDLALPIITSLVYEIPFVVLCREDCKGLCDRCYANLNNEVCTCKDEPDIDSPFAALKTLFENTDLDKTE